MGGEIEPSSLDDLSIASISFGFTLGFGFLTTWGAIKQTLRQRSPLQSIYIWLVWGEILVCFLFGLFSYFLIAEVMEVSLALLISLVFLWAFKVHFLLQIIINRIIVILPDRRKGRKVQIVVAIIITFVNISVFCIWIPARMGVSPILEKVNNIWDRVEKVIYLAVDAGLNWYFIRMVKQRLVAQGSTKYNRLVKFNVKIIFLSLAMDVMVLGTMSLKNSLVYIQFHPLAFIVKLNIEMSMASLIRKIAAEKTEFACSYGNDTATKGYELSASAGKSIATATANNLQGNHRAGVGIGGGVDNNAAHNHQGEGIMVNRAVIVKSEAMTQETVSQMSRESEVDLEDGDRRNTGDSRRSVDEAPLRDGSWARVAYNTAIVANGHP